VKDYLRFL